jgi:iron complex transport system ATP-binding protein
MREHGGFRGLLMDDSANSGNATDADIGDTDRRNPSASSNGSTSSGESSPFPSARGERRTEPSIETDETKVDATDLVLQYPGGETPVIDGASIAIARNTVTALIGPNGSGKSTLLRGLADQLSAQDGQVLLDGRAVDELPDRALARELGLISQEPTSPGALSVERLAYHGRYPHRGFFESVDDADVRAVERTLSLAGIKALRDRPLSDLSGGQRRLAWLAMTLAQDTDVLLLDEPTTFLDLRHQLAVMDVVETLRAESDRTVVLYDGEIRARGTPEEVVTEGLLASVFGVEAIVEGSERGPRVTPLRPVADAGRNATD